MTHGHGGNGAVPGVAPRGELVHGERRGKEEAEEEEEEEEEEDEEQEERDKLA